MRQDSKLTKDCVLVKADNATYLRARLAKGLPPARLAVLDPPYNFGQGYLDYEDAKKPVEFMRWSNDWMAAVIDSLTDDGSLFLFCPEEWVSEFDLALRSMHRMHRRRHIIWAFTFGQAAVDNFTRSHCHILYMCKDPNNYVFNRKEVLVPSARQAVYKDPRAAAGGKSPDDVWMLFAEQLEPCMTGSKTVWLESRICGTFKERKDHSPNQLPLPMIERIVKACSNEGDLTLDPFGGTFTTGVAARKHNRKFLGIDISQECVDRGIERIRREGRPDAD